MSVVLAEQIDPQWINLSFDYDPDIVDIVKAIPKIHRRYHPESRTWSVKVGSWVRLANGLEACGHRVLR